MRDATADLAHAVLAMVPVSAVAGEGTPVTMGLDAGAVPTAADLLDRDLVELLRGPLEGRNARELDEAVREAQKKAEAAVEAVAEAAAAHDDVLTEPGDLAKPEVADAFVKELRDRLEEGGVKLSEEEVRRAVASVTR